MAYPCLVIESHEVQVYPKTGEGHVQVSNAGRARFEIGDLASSCSCTSAKILDRVLEPGETTQMIAKVVGESDATIAIFSNGPHKERVFVIFSRRFPLESTRE